MKKKVLYIASNIPTPKKKNNGVVLTLAKKMSAFYDVEMIYPKPFVPFGFHLLPKHKYNYNLKPWKDGDISIFPASFVRLPLLNFAFILFKRLKFKMHGQKPALSHSHFLIPDGIFSYYLERDYNIPYIITLRGADVRHLEKLRKNGHDYKLVQKVLEKASKVTCLNDYQKKIVFDLFGIEAELIFNGIDEEDIIPFDSIIKNESQINICTIGTLLPQKQIQWVINSVLSYNGPETISLKIFGEGPYKSELVELSKNSKNIHFCGHVPREQILVELRSSHIFALPSVKETFGLVFLEAAAAGNAIIGHTREGIWKQLTPNEEIIYAENYQHFSEVLHSFIADRSKINSFGRKANIKSRAFTWKKLTQKLNNYYEEILSEYS